LPESTNWITGAFSICDTAAVWTSVCYLSISSDRLYANNTIRAFNCIDITLRWTHWNHSRYKSYVTALTYLGSKRLMKVHQ